MKAILISIKPKWVAKILNGEKTIEIRKTMPKCALPIDVYIYCMKDKKYELCYPTNFDNKLLVYDKVVNGKVVAKFTLNNIDEYCCEFHEEPLFDKDACYQSILLVDRDHDFPEADEYIDLHASNEEGDNDEEVVKESKFLQQCCLTLTEIKQYAGKTETMYGWHISNLEIFNKPKELSEFQQRRNSYGKVDFKAKDYYLYDLTKAPQSMCYIEKES